jgi:hypothetical protein
MNTEKSKAGGVFTVQCFDAAGNLKWEAQEHNLVVNEGLKFMNDTFFRGSAYTAAWFLGLISGPGSGTTYSANDTLASHAGWTEFTNYSGNRGSLVLDAATLADPSVATNSTPLSFTITGGGGVVAGAFLTNVATGTSGTLFSESDFQSPGDRTVVSGDTLNVTYTFSLDAA